MSIDIKLYGKIYKHITESIKANYGRYTLPWKYDRTKTAMFQAAKAEYLADSSYPIFLHEALSDIVLRWCFEGYKETGKEDINNIFTRLWKFQKKWLLIGETHTVEQIMTQMDKEATDEINDICSGDKSSYSNRNEKVISLYRAVIESVILIAKDEGSNDQT